MCPYCTGCLGDKAKGLFKSDAKISRKNFDLYSNLWIEQYMNGNFYLNLMISTDSDNRDQIFDEEFDIPIKYCPMCGQKLVIEEVN